MDMSLSKLWELVMEGKGSLACCSAWSGKESDTTEWLNWLTESRKLTIYPENYKQERQYQGYSEHEDQILPSCTLFSISSVCSHSYSSILERTEGLPLLTSDEPGWPLECTPNWIPRTLGHHRLWVCMETLLGVMSHRMSVYFWGQIKIVPSVVSGFWS